MAFLKQSFAEMERRLEEIEVDFDALKDDIRRISAYVNVMHSSVAVKMAYAVMDEKSLQVKKLIEEQAEIEMYLIENEAPGWTST